VGVVVRKKFKVVRLSSMKLLFLTSNEGKLKEAQAILGDIEVVGKSVDLDEIQSVRVEDVVKHKIEEAKKVVGKKKFFVEDTAVYLGKDKEVGVLIKFLSNDRIVKAFKGEVAWAVCAIGYSGGKVFKGVVKGKIVSSRGKYGFGWDPIFKPDGHKKTFGEMEREEKNRFSMRKIALEKLRRHLS